jgi:hypothetical protein
LYSSDVVSRLRVCFQITKWTTGNGSYADKYKEKETATRIDEITNSTEKLELLRMIDAAIWQAMDAESF